MLPYVMSQPVKLSDAIVLDARLVGEVVERSIAGQVEFWARLGRYVELLLEGQQVLTLCRNAATQPLSKLLETVDSPAGRSRVAAYLQSQPFFLITGHLRGGQASWSESRKMEAAQWGAS
jgi:hypothetical protein